MIARRKECFWANLGELGLWMNRNCSRCRFANFLPKPLGNNRNCPVPSEALAMTLGRKYDGPIIIPILFSPNARIDLNHLSSGPYKCYTFKDKRGHK